MPISRLSHGLTSAITRSRVPVMTEFDYRYGLRSKQKQSSLWGGALILSRSGCSVVNHNWWESKYLTRQLHNNSEDAQRVRRYELKKAHRDTHDLCHAIGRCEAEIGLLSLFAYFPGYVIGRPFAYIRVPHREGDFMNEPRDPKPLRDTKFLPELGFEPMLSTLSIKSSLHPGTTKQ